MLILDTDTLPAGERAAAYQEAISGSASTSVVSFQDATTFRARLSIAEVGPGRVLNVDATGSMLRRTPRLARRDPQNAIAIAVPLHGANAFRWSGLDQVIHAGELLLVDLDDPYEYGWAGLGSSYAFQVDRDTLDIPEHTIRRAASQLRSSPYYSLTRDRLMHVTQHADALTGRADATTVGADQLALMRALIASAAHDPALERETRDDALTRSVLDYVARHLVEPDLSADRIAEAHHLSRRHLFRLCERAHVSLERWIIDQRLERARAALTSPRTRYRTIAATARACGFTDPSFFSARFRRTYGLTPGEWRTEAGATPTVWGD